MGLSVPGSIASAGNGRKKRGRRADGRTGGGREEQKKQWREEEILHDLTGLIRFLVPEGGLTKSPKSPEAACYPSDPGGLFTCPSQNHRRLLLSHRGKTYFSNSCSTEIKPKPPEVRNDSMWLLSLSHKAFSPPSSLVRQHRFPSPIRTLRLEWN